MTGRGAGRSRASRKVGARQSLSKERRFVFGRDCFVALLAMTGRGSKMTCINASNI
ncbi:MAG: hypothetical protein LBL66_05895 [Clostridiales bacterium]|nr:hypothetical protein [Clostridiales bacterium]